MAAASLRHFAGCLRCFWESSFETPFVIKGTKGGGGLGLLHRSSSYTCAAGGSHVPVSRIGRLRPKEGAQGPQPRQGLFRGAPVRELVLILAHQNGQSPAEVLKDPLSPSSSTGGGMQSPDPLESSGMRCGVSLCHWGTCCSLVQLEERGLAPRRAGRKETQDRGQGGCRARGKGWRDGARRKSGPAPKGKPSEGGGHRRRWDGEATPYLSSHLVWEGSGGQAFTCGLSLKAAGTGTMPRLSTTVTS